MANPVYRGIEDLIRLCSLSDEKAWYYFVEEFAPLIRWAIKDKIDKSFASINENDIKDISQQTFAHIWRNKSLSKLKNPQVVSAYLTIIAQNAAVDFFRKNKRLTRFSLEGLNENNLYITDTPRTQSHNRQIEKEIKDFVDMLPIKERRVITLDIFYDLKHREISKLMDIPVNTVSTIIARIKRSLRDKLKQRGYDAA